jgi:predicted phosphoadenosine phosphosulfate sulfurtransferase
MPKVYTDTDVLTAAFSRIERVFDEFDNVYVSVSGGKDSSVMVQLIDMVAKRMNRTYDVLYIDFEAQYKATIDHIYELKKLPCIRDFYHICLPMALRNAVSVLQPKWICWDVNSKDLWVRDLPKDSINESNNPFPFFLKGQEFEEFIIYFAKWYAEKYGGLCACCVGIRADESLNRFRTVAFADKKVTLKNLPWTTLIHPTETVYNVYPIYDWRAEDIWGAVSKLDLKHNIIYDLMWQNGLTIYEQRLCQPYGDDQRNGLDQFRSLEYETWSKILNRVNGVNFGNIYCKTSALGNIKSMKPEFLTWQEYSIFLLESIGLYNKDLEIHYVEKIDKFFAWYEQNEHLSIKDIPDTTDLHDEQLKRAASWRRIARAIERNDFYMKRLSFSQNKRDEELLEKMISKWQNLLTHETITNDKHLKQFMEKKLK